MIVIDEIAISMRPDCTAGNRPLNGMFSICTVCAEALGDLVDQVDLEADELAGVLELPGHVADVGADLQLRPQRRVRR